MIHQILPKKTYLANLKSHLDKLDIDKLKNVLNNLSNLKSKVNKLDIYKLLPVPVDLSKLNDLVKYDVAKKTEYNESVKKVNNISTTDARNLVRKTDYNIKISEIEN